MQVKVSVPSLLNSYINLKDILSSLKTQSFSDFELNLIVPGNLKIKDEFLGLFEQYGGDYKLIRQSGRGFENAVNEAIQGKYDINVSTDDDAVLPKDHLLKIVKKFSNPKIGVITGRVNGDLPYFNRTFYLYLVSSLLSKNKDISNLKDVPVVYFNNSGLLTFNIFKSNRLFRKEFNTMSPIGVNMAWSQEALTDFHLVEFSRLGTLNESYISYHAFMRGYDTIFSRELNVYHKLNGNSLSRQKNLYDDLTKFLEFFFSPFILGKTNVVDKSVLSRAYLIPMPSIYKMLLIEILKSLQTISKERWSENKVKSIYNRILAEVKNKFSLET